MTVVSLIVLGALVVGIISLYNRLVGARNAFGNAFAQIDVQLTRRYDLIPNLVEVAKTYLKHERETLEAVIRARNAASEGLRAAAASPGNAAATQRLEGAEAELGGALGRLFALAEAYPDLKASSNFVALQQELGETEDQLAFARQYYNDAVASLNTAATTLPWMAFAPMAGVHKRDFYEAPDAHQAPPQVAF